MNSARVCFNLRPTTCATAPADSGVHLVENHRGYAAALRLEALSASITRESSPPEAIRSKGIAG